MSGSIIALLLAVCLFGKGYGYDEELRCPDKFIVEKVNTLTLEVNSTVIQKAECAVPARFLAFTIKRANDNSAGTVDTICSTEFNCPSPGPVGKPTTEDATCGCVKKSENNVVLFEMKLFVNEMKDSGANLSFNLCSRPVHPIRRNIASSCTKIVVGKEPFCGTGCIVGIVVGLITVIVIIVVVILFMRSRGFRGMPVRS